MKLLLHTCCAPCLIYPAEELRKIGFEVTGFFYNPNIYPAQEYEKRRMAAADFSKAINIEVIFPEYNPDDFLGALGDAKEVPERCRLCWGLRLKKTAEFAAKSGFDSFTTTLLVSPYQDQGVLKNVGEEIAAQAEIGFYFEDFRPGFRAAHNQARAGGMYCQKYCGCMYSFRERQVKPKSQILSSKQIPNSN